MTPDRAQRVAELFEQLVDLPPAEREAALARLDDPGAAVREKVEALLAADADVESGAGSPLLTALAPRRADAAAEEPPRRIGPYRLVRKLGEGGMSEVFLGLRDDGELESRVAVKLIRRELLTPEMVRRFGIERQILASLSHPSIARVLDAGRTEDGVPYFIMEYIEGEPIDEYCDRHRLSIPERLEIFRQVCLAVHCAHQNLVVHRDIKPSNILVTEAGQPKLLDFGIAKLLNPGLVARGTEPTVAQGRLLTPDYASPEQVLGKAVTPASDVYSLGVLLFKLLTGADPYRLRERAGEEVEQRILTVEPDAPSAWVRRRLEAPRDGASPPPAEELARRFCTLPRAWLRALSGDLDAVVAKALRKEPQNRYASAEQMAAELHRHLMRRQSPFAGKRFAAPAGRVLSGWSTAALVVVLLAAVGGLIFQTVRLGAARATAKGDQERARDVVSAFERLLTEATANRELADRAARRVHRDLAGQPATQADLLMSVGRAYVRLHLLDEAATSFQAALGIRKRLFGPAHPRVADSVVALAEVEAAQGDFDEAEALQRSALEMRRKHFSGPSLEVTESQIGLGRVFLADNHPASAEAEFLEALATRKELLGPGDVRVAEALNDLGHAVGRLGSPSGAASLFERASKIERRSSGPRSWKLAVSLLDQAEALFALDRRAEGKELLLEAAAIERRRCAEPTAGVAVPLVRLAQSALHGGASRCQIPALPVPHAAFLVQSVQVGLAEIGDEAESASLSQETVPVLPPLAPAVPLLEDTTPATGSCVPDGGFAQTLAQRCCSGVIAGGTTVCSNPHDWGTTWATCRHVCGSRLVGGCVPPGGITDTLGLTDCCSGSSVSGSGRCLNPADSGTSWRSCVHTCA